MDKRIYVKLLVAAQPYVAGMLCSGGGDETQICRVARKLRKICAISRGLFRGKRGAQMHFDNVDFGD